VNADARVKTLIALAVLPVAAVFLLVDPYPQPAGYFLFADTRPVAGVPNFWNVSSNLMFLVFGVAGLLLLRKGRLSVLPGMKPAYVVFFAGIALTAFGSGWFHMVPSNDSLAWDRLPMTLAFMSLFAIVLGEHLSEPLGRKLLLPLLITGAAAVLYWSITEAAGRGDLRAYGLVQFLPMLLIPAVLVMFPSAFDRHRFLWGAFALYALAKVFEVLDSQILSIGGVVSGHSLKHVVASFVPLVLIQGMRHRRRK
jgi:hypothetical protein